MNSKISKMTIIFYFIFLSCSLENPSNNNTGDNTSWIFVANEGSFGASDGSISMIDTFGNILETEFIGDVVQSLIVYQNKLIVLINNDHLIKIYDITSEGLRFPGIEISTNNSSPREMLVLNNMLYFIYSFNINYC